MFWKKRRQKNIHLDFLGTTPVDKKIFKKMKGFFSVDFYNPSSIYMDAKKIKDLIEEYRKKIAKILQVKNTEIIFTNGGTESINLAILGIAKKFQIPNPNPQKLHMVSTKIEHPAVLESLKEAERLGAKVTYLDVDEEGIINIEDFKKSLSEETKLVAIGYANSEIGVIQDISRIGREILKFKNILKRSEEDFPFFFCDASQAGLTLDLNVNRLKVDMMTLDGSKIYGPKANGCLIKKNYVEISPILFGGGQEWGLRAGTENVAGIIGFCEALILASRKKEKDKKHFEKLQKYMLEKIAKEIPEAELNGVSSSTSLRASRLSNNINICIKGLNSEFAVIMMDEFGINCSSMTACKSMKGNGQSYVIEALGKPKCVGSSLRFSFGRKTTRKDIDKTIKALRKTVDFQLLKE